jgi:hypothetical protein
MQFFSLESSELYTAYNFFEIVALHFVNLVILHWYELSSIQTIWME